MDRDLYIFRCRPTYYVNLNLYLDFNQVKR